MNLLISCEAGGQRVPSQLADLFQSAQRSAARPESSDPWASYVARRLAEQLRAPLLEHVYSLEVVDVTRSLHHPRLFSPLTRNLSVEDRQMLLDTIYHPYRQRLRDAVKSNVDRRAELVHLSVRTFESYYRGKPRRTDVGLLYDPAVDGEVDFCLDWMDLMYDDTPMLRVRRNYPRRGTTDSITKWMRSQFSDRGYLGIEVLLNRAWAARAVPLREEAIDAMARSLQAVPEASWSDAA